MTFPTAASSFVASIYPCVREGPNFLPSDAQTSMDNVDFREGGSIHSRREFFVRAFKPAVSSDHEYPGKYGSSDSPERGDAVEAMIGMASMASNSGISLHARRELARKRLRQRRLKKSFDSAVGAVDWLAADLGKLMTFAKTLPLFLGDKTKEDDRRGEENVASERDTISDFLQLEGIDREATASSYPRCSWPRLPLKVESEAFFAESLLPTGETALLSRRSWARDATVVENATASPSVNPLVVYPRCAWPRILNVSHSATSFLVEDETDEQALVLDVLVPSTAPDLNYPRCSWPRASPNPLLDPPRSILVAPPSDTDSSQVSLIALQAQIGFEAARCSWPKTPLEIDTTFPRCEWPRKPSASDSTPRSLVQEIKVAITTDSEIEGITLTSPRCSWPKTPLEIDTTFPRCEWPRKPSASESTPRPLVQEIKVAITTDSEIEEGITLTSPRCSWPRASKAVPSTFPVCDPTAGPPISFVPRCSWPRGAAATGFTTQYPLDEVPTQINYPPSEAVLGPRCSWPGKDVKSPSRPELSVSVLSQDSIQAEFPLSPRCNWPRHVINSLPSLTHSSPAPATGARCSWPRNPRPQDFTPITTKIEAVDPSTPLGPRCPWPRSKPGHVPPLFLPASSFEATLNKTKGSGMDPTPLASDVKRAADRVMNKSDISPTWPRRLMATTVGLSLMNHFFTGQGGQAFAQPLDAFPLKTETEGISTSEVNKEQINLSKAPVETAKNHMSAC